MEGLRIRVHSGSSDLGFVIYWNLIWDESIALLSLSLHLKVIHLLSSWLMWLLKSIICYLAFGSSYRLSPLAGPLLSLPALHSHSKMPPSLGSLPEAPRGRHKMRHPEHPLVEDSVPQVCADCKRPSPFSCLPTQCCPHPVADQ